MGLVHASGRAAFAARDAARSGIYSFENSDRVLDETQIARFKKQEAAWKYFESQAPYYRRVAAFWVVSAKRPETRERRLQILIEHSAKGERLPALSRAVRPSA